MRQFIKSPRAVALTLSMAVAAIGLAADYTYLTEGFEDAAWKIGKATVSVATGDWTVNKNKSTDANAHSGTSALEFTYKDGLTSPFLSKGAGAVVYYALDNNRQVYVEKSSDGKDWVELESYKETTPWTKHVVMVNDPDARYVRLRLNSNKQFFIDDLLITLPDGTDGNGNQIVPMLRLPYFTNDFENKSLFPSSKDEVTTEKAYVVENQGEWLYYNAYRNTNTSYIPDGSSYSLRMLKNGAYIVTPTLSQGVVSVKFDEGRTGRKLVLYTSTDNGATWTAVSNIETDTQNEVQIYDPEVNRVKLANESSSDADIDNITIYAYPGGTKATVVTKDATDVTPSSAKVGGEITDSGDRPLSSVGICWSASGMPDINSETVETVGKDFNITLSGLPASTLINYRAYAVSIAGVAYGEVKSFTTAPAEKASVSASTITEVDELTSESVVTVKALLEINDDGGSSVTEAGYKVETSGQAATEVKGYPVNDNFYAVMLQLMPDTEYILTPFAENSVGCAYGSAITYSTPKIEAGNYRHNTYYCDPSGDDATADGSMEHPFFSLQKAADLVVAGDTIYMNAGTYKYKARVNIKAVGEKNDGYICLWSRNGRAILDFKENGIGDNNQGIRHTGSYWHFYGLDIVNAGDNGMLIERNKPSGGVYSDIVANTEQAHHNIIEYCTFSRCADSGLQMKNLAAYNMVINCDSYLNRDEAGENADGFAVKLSHGDGNYFYGCRAWCNSDDGWDQFVKKEGGFPDDNTTTYDNCWAFKNGFDENNNPYPGGSDGNGFKMGSAYGRNNVIMNRCLAFDNLQKGFDQNHNTGHMILNNCTGYAAKYTENKSHYTYRIEEPVASGHEIRFTNCIAVSDGIADRNKSGFAPYAVKGEEITCDFNTLPEDFLSISTEGMDGPRDADGNLPELDFMKIRPDNTRLIDAGTIVLPYIGESVHSKGITFNGSAPDLGCFETKGSQNGINDLEISAVEGKLSASAVVTKSGLVVVTIEGIGISDSSTATAYDLSGRGLSSVNFTGTTVTLDLSKKSGIAIICITTPRGMAALKVKL